MAAVARGAALALALGASGCFAFVTKEDGKAMQDNIDALKASQKKSDAQITELKRINQEKDAKVVELTRLLDEATKVVTRNSANIGQDVDKLKVDIATATGRVDVIESTLGGLNKSFNDFRAQSDTKIEQLINATTAAKAPPIPETPDAAYAEGKKRFDAREWKDARRVYDAFIARYPTDTRAASAQFQIGKSYEEEGKFANAIGAFAKVIDNYQKSEVVPDAMYENGKCFYALKYCSDARVYFQELLKRYPKTNWKKDATEELKKLQRDLKNKAVCQS
jgi:tol-pal system protein YbgF